MIFLGEKDVEENLDIGTTIEAVKDGFVEYFKGEAGADPRIRTYAAGAVLNTMPAFINKYHIAGMKAYIGTRTGAKFVVIIFDTQTSEVIAIIEANRLGQLRTGAVTALATSLLKEHCSVFTLIGAGFQAETQLEGILRLMNPEQVRVYSRTDARGREFSERMEAKFGREVRYYSNIQEAIGGADVISSITSAQVPVLTDLSSLSAFHLNLAGANVLTRREASGEVLRSGDLVVVEHLEQALRESSEITEFVSGGGKPVEFKDVVGQPERYRGYRRTIFKSMGIGLEDIVTARYLLKKMGLI